MVQKIAPFIDSSKVYFFAQIGFNEHYKKIYRDLIDYFTFSLSIHVDSLRLPSIEEMQEVQEDGHNYLPIGMTKELAEKIDELMPEASIILRTAIWYEIASILHQRSIFDFSIRKSKMR